MGHRTHDYADDVATGAILAGPYVRGICERHMRDLENGHERGLYFSEDEAAYFQEFFPVMLTVEVANEVVPFELIDWQAFCVGSIFGWRRLVGSADWQDLQFDHQNPKAAYFQNTVRRFRTAYIETGKGSGKSPLAAGVGLACLFADSVLSAEVYAAATIKPQAMILFNDATAMIQRSPRLNAMLHPSGKNPVWQWTHIPSRSRMKPLSKDEAVSGPRPSCNLIDEYHEHATADTYEMLEAGFKGRRNPLQFVITNSGSNKQTPCGELHEWAGKVCLGTYDAKDQAAADTLFAYISALDDDDDPFVDETCWPKANPSLGKTITHDYLRKQVNAARAMPSRANKILRLNFCRWTDADTAWITRGMWERCETDLDLWDRHRGDECYGGLDLSYTTDLSALALVWPWIDDAGREMYDAKVFHWKPEKGLAAAVERDKVRYDLWAEQGHLILTPGKVIKLPSIASKIGEIQSIFSLESLAYDRFRLKELYEHMCELNLSDVPLVEHPQWFKRTRLYDVHGKAVLDPQTGRPMANPYYMPNSCQELENAVLEERLRVEINPVTRMNVSSAAVKRDDKGTDAFVFHKGKATKRIDGLVALAMAIGAAKARKIPQRRTSPWEDPNFSLASSLHNSG